MEREDSFQPGYGIWVKSKKKQGGLENRKDEETSKVENFDGDKTENEGVQAKLEQK